MLQTANGLMKRFLFDSIWWIILCFLFTSEAFILEDNLNDRVQNVRVSFSK